MYYNCDYAVLTLTFQLAFLNIPPRKNSPPKGPLATLINVVVD